MSSQTFAPPKKALGQNFLQDPNIIRKIVAAVAVRPDDILVEIGPGRGALTEQLIDKGVQLHLIELDRELSQYWQQRAQSLVNLTVHQQDVLKFDFQPLGKFKIIGNLPYNISSPILFHLMQYADQISYIVVMLQLEVVQRMCAHPGNKQYGRLSVMLQQQCQIHKLFNVPANAFYPPPKVESAIVQLTPTTNNTLKNPEQFAEIVKQSFSQRRKTLRNNLKRLISAEQIMRIDIDPGARAETLSVDDFVRLSEIELPAHNII